MKKLQDEKFSKIRILIEENYKIVVCLFFVAYLFVGVNIFKDYGIPWDEEDVRYNGIMSLEYIFYGDQALLTHAEKYHGPAFEILLVVIRRILNLTRDPRAVYLMRHLVTFLLFYTSLLFFYLLCRRRFQSWKIGLLGSLFLILSPRIFADSFYNSKDIACLSLFIISIYTLVRYLDKKILRNASFHALTCALLIDVRIVGIIVPFFTIIFLGADLLITKIEETKSTKIVRSLLIYMILLSFFTVLFWPALWPNPLYSFIEAFKQMSHYPWPGNVLYFGKYINSADLPWHYIPVWIIISTPVLYIVCFFTGCSIVVKLLLKDPRQFYINKRDDLIYMAWFFLPLLAVIILRSVLYDAWRQMFFIYPAFLMLALAGLTSLFGYFKIKFQRLKYKIINTIFIIIVALSLIDVAKFMIRYHPFQNVYFNQLAGKNMQEVKANFELDYWGLSYRQALEYILKNDSDSIIKIYVANFPGKINANILDAADRCRLMYVKKPEEAKYFLSNYRGHKEEYPYKEELFSIKVNEAKIMVVYKIN